MMYLDSYTEIVYAIEYASGKVSVCESKRLPNGRILLIETVSKSRGSLQFKNAIGVSEEKYQTDYVAVYKKKVGTNTRGSNSSNNSLHDDTDSIISIHNAKPEVNENEDLAEPNITEYSLSPADDSGRELTQEQRDFFRDTKAVTRDGRLMTLYHQTDSDFTVFDVRKKGAGSSDNGTPFGIFLKSSDKDIGLRGKKQMPLYANITNPIQALNREDLTRKLRGLSPEYGELLDQIRMMDEDYHERYEAAERATFDRIAQWRKENPDARRQAVYEDPEFNNLMEAEEVIQESL